LAVAKPFNAGTQEKTAAFDNLNGFCAVTSFGQKIAKKICSLVEK